MAPGLMLDKGYRLPLQPDRYPKHAALCAKLERSRAWEIEGEWDMPGPRYELDTEEETDPLEGLLPHQRDAIQRARKMTKSP